MRRRGLWACLIVLGVLAGVGVTMLSRSWTTPAEAAPAPAPAPIDAARAYGYLKAICDLGPRPAGSAANTRQRAMVAAHFKKMGATVREQPFEANDPRTGAKVAMANLIGAWHPERTQRVVLGAHYDTRPFPDQERDPARRKLPFLGANDGASGVALLMEIAHHLDALPTPWGVDLVLFDGEELVYGQGAASTSSAPRQFARAHDESVRSRRATSRYVAALVLDMVGDRNLTRSTRSSTACNFTSDLVQEVWARRAPAQGDRLPQPDRDARSSTTTSRSSRRASPPSTSSTSTTPTGTPRRTSPSSARARAWRKSAGSSPPGWRSPTSETLRGRHAACRRGPSDYDADR